MTTRSIVIGETTVYNGDCLDVMTALAVMGTMVDSIVTDPPYHLTTAKRFATGAPALDPTYARMSKGFMGKTWDGGNVAFNPETWRRCYDLLKPGGHMAVFGGSRTYHRMACAIEDAGFEIRDRVRFECSYMTKYGALIDSLNDAQRDRLKDLLSDITGGNELAWIYGTGFPKSHYAGEGRGTALKPAHEPIVLARKPLIGTVAENVLTHGTGAINIDACRVPSDKIRTTAGAGVIGNTYNWSQTDRAGGGWESHDSGRFPANVIHDGSDEVIAAFPNTNGSGKGGVIKYSQPNIRGDNFNRADGRQVRDGMSYGDSGSAARFFYSAKANAKDRAGSKHPTVKPIDLIRYLATLITPPGGLCFDPFAGSGTLAAAWPRSILIEREDEYYTDIIRRLTA